MPEFDPRSLKVLHATLDLPVDQRNAFVDGECAGDLALLASVRRLLAQDAADVCALDQPLEAFAAPLFDENVDDEAPPEYPIGSWRIISKLGQGGMGSVWLAERADGEYVQRVALKRIKRGMDSNHMQTQFRRERDALARLQHPNIAQLIDGGVDESGRPWFAMELVDGVSLTDWITQRNPSLRQRLQLFVKLCRAVAHAHARLVVHRDLKPSNVLVQADDEPRLLDFGVAKLVESDDAEKTVTVMRFFSRAYAAPEQLNGDPVTTATDVFALGLLLFELLTDSRYRELHKYGEVTLRPSAALGAIASGHATISRTQLRGDLDAITMRALAEELTRRYSSADALADDVERHLEGRAVLARPDSTLYRISKLIQRHRVAVVVTTIGLVALLVASGIAFWQAHAKTLEAERARVALRQSESTRAFTVSMFVGADPSYGKGLNTTAGELLAIARERVSEELADEPAVAAALLDQIGNTYVSLSEDELARQALSEALAFNAKAAVPSLYVEGSAGARMAFYAFQAGNSAQALADLDRLIDKLRPAATTADLATLLAKAMDLKSNLLYATGEHMQSLQSKLAALTVLESMQLDDTSEYVFQLVGYSSLAAALDRGDEALDAIDRALAHPLLRGKDSPPALLMTARAGRGRALQVLERYAEAEPVMIQAISDFSAIHGKDAALTRYWRFRFAEVLHASGRLDEAQEITDTLLSLPSDGSASYRRIRTQVTAAAIAKDRGAEDARARIVAAEMAACSEQGNTEQCDKARALLAEF